MISTSWKIWVDTGGTFTDCIAVDPFGNPRNLKVLSSGILRVRLKAVVGKKISIVLPVALSANFLTGFRIKVGREIRTVVDFSPALKELTLDRRFHDTQFENVAEIYTGEEVPVFAARLLTETSLGRDFPPIEMKLGSTRGTNALLERKGAKTIFLVTKGFKDLIRIGDQQRHNLFALNIVKPPPLYHQVIEVAERIESDGGVHLALDKKEITRIITLLKREKVSTVAIAFLNSYKNPIHEQLFGNALKEGGIAYTSLSHKLSSQIKILHRAETAIVNAYLEPIIHEYISNIQSRLNSASIRVMSSAGGLLSAEDFRPKDSLLSGPAGGVIGALKKAKLSGVSNIITFDMGGTSTDVSRCNDRPDYRFDCTVGNLRILTPSVNIETIAAGGGSICAYDGFKFTVGPESAGANPGPACYGVGGPLSITDVNLLLGRLDPDNFSIPIDIDKSRTALQNVIKKLGRKKAPNATAILESFIAIANEKMAEAIRKISIQKGHDPKDYALFCFGGAGGQHACSLATLLGIRRVIIPHDAGLLSAYGIGHSALESVREKLVLKKLRDEITNLESDSNRLSEEARNELIKNGADTRSVFNTRRLVFLRLKGQETALEVEWEVASEIEGSFIKQYRKLYDHWLETREIEVESLRVIVTVGNDDVVVMSEPERQYKPKPDKTKRMRISGSWLKCPVFKWENLLPGAGLNGPSLLLSDTSTLLIEEGWTFDLDRNYNGIIRSGNISRRQKEKAEEAQLELFTNRFTAIAEEMGTLLQRTSFSVNVKERLDFSCALLDKDGNLVVNAPHIPVHLGSMGVCVRAVMKVMSAKDGDVIITNHPAYGGSHLPDITLIKPVFVRKTLIGFVANRAHHAEVGGSRPGSMPSDATCLEEEGVVISPTYLVRNGISQWDSIRSTFTTAPFPTRALEENLADLNGALMSLQQGAESLKNLCKIFGSEEVIKYMTLLRQHASRAMGEKFRQLKKYYDAEEYLDDGSKLKVRISKEGNRLHIDFRGCAPVHKGNLNATPAIVNSVILYVLRLLINESIPLNEGLLKNVSIHLPTCILNPVFHSNHKLSPAVVGGNTEISQRLTDTLLKALRLSSCSQGTMNNFLFGNEKFGYYETICGGVGAGQGFNGFSGVHQHMTNTRITDPEIVEYRYGVRLEKFEIRKGSGGSGKWRGGDGVERQFYFKESYQVSILSQHRIVAPFGMNGGRPGKTGEQYLIRGNKRKKLKGTDGLVVAAGDRILIKTPGGGGWGKLRE
jgi:5-oxoprolinase (ATP-hydrolysing)